MTCFSVRDKARLEKAMAARARGTSIEGSVRIALTDVSMGDHFQYLKAEFTRALRNWKAPDELKPVQGETSVVEVWATTSLLQAAKAFEDKVLEDVPVHDR